MSGDLICTPIGTLLINIYQSNKNILENHEILKGVKNWLESIMRQKQAISIFLYFGAVYKAMFPFKIVLQLCHHDKSGAHGVKKDVTPLHAIDADRFSFYYHTS